MDIKKVYKYTVNVKEDAKVEDILLLMSNEVEKGILFTKSIQGKNRIVIYGIHNGMTFNQIGKVMDVEPYQFYTATDYDVFDEDMKEKLYKDDENKIIYIELE